MASKTRLLLIPCSGNETAKLTKDIFNILKEDYGLDDQVERLSTSRSTEVKGGTLKDHRHDFVVDFFPDMEAQIDIGRNDLKDVIQGKHIALVTHLLTPNRPVSVNDHIMELRGILDVIANTDTLQRTLIAPYLTYVRSHSIEKYKKRGFYQFDSLKKTMEDYRRDGLDCILTIDPHSNKAEQMAHQLGMEFQWVNPFQSARAINPFKLGLKGEKAEELTTRLRPYQERLLKLKQEHSQHLYIVSVDDGTEKRAENFIERAHPELSPAELYALLAYFGKDRMSYDDSQTEFKPFSIINRDSIDPEGTYIIIDDMFSSGGTANRVAKILKSIGAKRVEVWVTHAVTASKHLTKANDRQYIDQVVALDTVPQHPDLKVEYIPVSAHLLAAELYKAHQRLVASR